MKWDQQIRDNCEELEGGCLKYKFRQDKAPRLSIWFDFPTPHTLKDVYIPKIMYFYSPKGEIVESIEDLNIVRTCNTKHCCQPDHYKERKLGDSYV